MYITNDLKDIENASGMKRLQDDGKTVFLVRAKDSKTDAYTGGLRITIPENTPLDQTGGLPINLRICVGARVMLTNNVDISDKLVNGSTGTVMCLHRVRNNKNAQGTVYVKFDNPHAGDKRKDGLY